MNTNLPDNDEVQEMAVAAYLKGNPDRVIARMNGLIQMRSIAQPIIDALVKERDELKETFDANLKQVKMAIGQRLDIALVRIKELEEELAIMKAFRKSANERAIRFETERDRLRAELDATQKELQAFREQSDTIAAELDALRTNCKTALESLEQSEKPFYQACEMLRALSRPQPQGETISNDSGGVE